MKHRRAWRFGLPFVLFIVFGMAYFWNARGDDLASSYVGCRVLATGNGSSLYSYDPENFAGISDADKAWPQLAAQGGYTSYLHPYVQTPLWAWALQPACNHMRFSAFKHLFLLLSLLSIAGCVYLTARYWTPGLFHPAALTFVLLALSLSEPFLFAMELVQTHALLLLLTLAGLVLAQRNRPVLGGLCVALAAAVKITPGVLLVYWLATRRWRAAASLAVWSLVLLALTRWLVGPSLFRDYLANMHRVSNVLLVSENNQSLAAWYMGHFFSPDEVFDVNAFPLPQAVRLSSTACLLLCAGAGGWLDQARGSRTFERQGSLEAAPFGAALTLVAMTVFAPIAWTHYFIVLAIPLMMLAQAALNAKRGLTKWFFAVAVLMIAALLYPPFAPDVVHMDLGDFAVLRGTFYAGLLCLPMLIVAQGSTRFSNLRR